VQSRNLIVELVAALVEAAQALGQRFAHEGLIDLAASRLLRRNADLLEHVVEPPRIAVGRGQQQFPRFGGKLQAAQRGAPRPLEQPGELFRGEWLQDIDRGP
jgi:hypothetical protein